MLCTQVLNGLVSALGVLNFDAGREFDVVAVSFNPKEGPGLASQKKASLHRALRPAADGRGLALPDRLAGVDHAPDRGGRIPLRVRPEDRPVRARRGHRGPDAEGHDREVLLRHRILAARSPARAHRGRRTSTSARSSTTCCSSATTTTRRPVSTARVSSTSSRRGVATVLAFAIFLTVSLRRDHALAVPVNTGAGITSPGTEPNDVHEPSVLPAASVGAGGAGRRASTSSWSPSRRSSRC